MKPAKPLTIGIDIDGTVTDPASIVPLMNESFGKNLCFADCTDYNLATVYGISEEAFADWLRKHGERLYRLAPVHGEADRVLRDWWGNHRLVYISAREPRHLDVTREWFDRYRIPFDEIELIGSHDKLAAARKWAVDLFLEDRLENAVQLATELQIPVFLFDTPYNRSPLPPLVQRVHSWRDVHRRLTEHAAVIRKTV